MPAPGPRDCVPSCSPCTFPLMNHSSLYKPALIQPLRDCAPAIDRAAAIAAVHEYLLMYTRVYAHALRAATESETSIFDHEQVGTMGWQCSVCNIQGEYDSADTSKCAVSHNCLRTRAILTLCKILHSSHCTVFSSAYVRVSR